jgi:MFS family permease
MVAGAANDNAVKTAFVVSVTVLNWEFFGISPVILANAAALLFILPFILLASRAAHFANTRPPKQWLLFLKRLELLLTAMALIAIWSETGWLLLLALTGFGVQSAFIGPLKYALIPKLAVGDRLISSNAWMESGTFIAILVGTLFGADWMVDRPEYLMALVAMLAITGLASLTLLPTLPASDNRNREALPQLIHRLRRDKSAMAAIWCLSGFWGLGSVWLTHLPILATDIWAVSARSVGTLLSQFVMGVALGAIAGVLSRRLPPFLRVIVGASVLVLGTLLVQTSHPELGQLGLVVTAAGGGFLALPLYTSLQNDQHAVADRIAVNNVANALMIVATALASMAALTLLGLSLLHWFLVLAFGQLFLCLYHRGNLRLNE